MVVVVAVVVAVVAVMQMMCEVGGGARERLACCSFQPSIYAKIHRVFNGGVALIGHFIPFPIRLGKFRIPHSAFRIPHSVSPEWVGWTHFSSCVDLLGGCTAGSFIM